MNNDWITEFDELFGEPPMERNGRFNYTQAHIKVFIQSLLDKQREELKSQLSEIVDDWYSKAPAYRNKAELKGMLHDLLTKLEKE